jgi:protocatechuate 3,4-dioxygenase beta subunit
VSEGRVVSNPIGRRSALRALGAVGAASLASCRGTAPANASTSARCVITATETSGPFPLRSVLGNPALVRQDITEGKAGIPLTLALKIVDHDKACAALSGAAVYIWHCDANGEYSGYSARENGTHARETFLRGVQLTDADGQVTFTTIFPGWYMPRLTHIHVQIFVAGSVLSPGTVAAATTQLCFPDAVTVAAYGNAVLYPKGQNRVTPTYANDQVFGNGIGTELLTVSGSATTGYHAGIVIGMSSTGSSPESGDAGGGLRGPGPGGAGGPPPFPAPPGIGRAPPDLV